MQAQAMLNYQEY